MVYSSGVDIISNLDIKWSVQVGQVFLWLLRHHMLPCAENSSPESHNGIAMAAISIHFQWWKIIFQPPFLRFMPALRQHPVVLKIWWIPPPNHQPSFYWVTRDKNDWRNHNHTNCSGQARVDFLRLQTDTSSGNSTSLLKIANVRTI